MFILNDEDRSQYLNGVLYAVSSDAVTGYMQNGIFTAYLSYVSAVQLSIVQSASVDSNDSSAHLDFQTNCLAFFNL